jgi:hypothetical protein
MGLKATVWTPFVFSVALSGICLFSYLFGPRSTNPGSEVWIIPFLCFLPLSFQAACSNQRENRNHIKRLEARIQRLEADRTAGS